MPTHHQPLLSRTFDAAVFGGGYAGFAAVARLRAAGLSCLWVDRAAALLWEGGWAGHVAAGSSDLLGWQAWETRLTANGGMQNGLIDGAIAEIAAACVVRDEQWDVLAYATPMAVEQRDGQVVGVIIGSKSGLQRISARRWLDATEDGELVRLLGAVPAAPVSRTVAVTLRHVAWGVDAPGVPGVWPDERRLVTALAAGDSVQAGWLRVLPATLDKAVVTHASVVPFNTYAPASAPQLPTNVASAVAAFAPVPLATLAARYVFGQQTAEALLKQSPAIAMAFDAPLPEIIARDLPAVDVAVAGTGTGGAVAVLAAAISGSSVAAFDPLPFAGGIGAGGGIHWYYYGMKGGLQEEVDAQVRALMPRFAAGGQIQGFHPDAKKAALDAQMTAAGVRPFIGTLVSVCRVGRTISDALIATPEGPVRLTAKSWIDATGDGDLCARAGCESRFGRVGDGLPHAFSQSSGTAWEKDGVVRLGVVNFDQGFVDATDVTDLSRARLLGISQYRRERYEHGGRPNYIAPALGLRQSRHIVTRTTLELTDLIERRTFTDAVGYTGCHYDNHASDYEFESDEGQFWVWACRAWSGRTACEIPYGILVPRDIDNAWIACRALGVSQDAHHSLRMQRDMQRIGEVAGRAATQHARTGAVDLTKLRADLTASGALELRKAEDDFGPDTDPAWFSTTLNELRDADWGKAGYAMWRLYQARDAAALRPLLDDAAYSWRAAAVLAMLGDGSARNRLWQAISTREDGFAEQAEHLRPERWNRAVPVWRQAIGLLRCCGESADIISLEAELRTQELTWGLATQIATTVERLARRGDTTAIRISGAALLDRCVVATRGAQRDPQENHNRPASPVGEVKANDRAPVRDDATWQLVFAVARARQALGLAVPLPAELASDDRAVVRRAFLKLTADVKTAEVKASAAR